MKNVISTSVFAYYEEVEGVECKKEYSWSKIFVFTRSFFTIEFLKSDLDNLSNLDVGFCGPEWC